MTIDIETLRAYVAFDKALFSTKGLHANIDAVVGAFVLADGDCNKALELLKTNTTEDEDGLPGSLCSQMVAAATLVLAADFVLLDYYYDSPEARRTRRATARAENRAAREARRQRMAG